MKTYMMPSRARLASTARILMWAVMCGFLPAHAQGDDRSAQSAQVTTAKPSSIPAPPDVAAPPAGAQTTASGISMTILKPGRGADRAEDNDCVVVNYTGWKRDGTLFSTSQSMGDGLVQCLNVLMPGIAEALRSMVVGEKRRIWVPAALTGSPVDRLGKIRPGYQNPPAMDLTFDVELVQTIKAPPVPADLHSPPREAIKTSSGLVFRILRKGTGTKHPSMTSQVTLNFSGWTSDGKLFESTAMVGHPAMFLVGTTHPGWREGLPYMVVGDKARFWIPAELAYGAKFAHELKPPGSVVYDIELVNMQ